MADYQNPFATSAARAIPVDAGLRAYMLRIYNYMASGLALTGITALLAVQSDALMALLYRTNEAGAIAPTGLGYVVAFAPLAFVLFLSFRIQQMSLQNAQISFWAFSVVMGLSMANIFLFFTGESIARTFFITAGTFGAMSLYGYTTKRDLTGMGNFLIMGVIGLIIASVVNMFMASSTMSFVISALGVLIFTGLTAYDTQRLKTLYYQLGAAGDMAAKMAIMGALNLYLDFINLFMMLLRFMGERR